MAMATIMNRDGGRCMVLVSALLIFLFRCPVSAYAQVQDAYLAQYWAEECPAVLKSQLCSGYFIALTSANEFATYIQRRPLWCSSTASIYQQHAVVMKYVKDNPKLLDSPFFGVAVLALSEAYPCEK